MKTTTVATPNGSKTIDINPGWKGMMRILIFVLENGTAEAKREAKAELMDLAEKLDKLIEADDKPGGTK